MNTIAVRKSGIPLLRWLQRLGLLAAISAISIIGYWFLQQRGSASKANEHQGPPMPSPFVSAIGRLEPESRVVQVAAPMAMEPARIDRLEVNEGDWIEKGDRLALLDTHARRKAAEQEAAARVTMAEAKVAQVKAGAKPGEIAAQEAMVHRDEAALRNAEADWQRIDTLAATGAATKSERDRQRKEWQTAERTVEATRATLAALREVREVDVLYAEAELTAAQAALQKSRADVDASQLLAPFASRVLRIHARPGEKVGDKGVLELADTSHMQAVAEVYEGDIGRVKLGQPASIRIPAMDLTLPGVVAQIGNLIGRKDIFDNDPVADTDARVVEVRIDLLPTDAKRVERLTNLRIEIRIEVAPIKTHDSRDPVSSGDKLIVD